VTTGHSDGSALLTLQAETMSHPGLPSLRYDVEATLRR
jgi:hypothetical protein